MMDNLKFQKMVIEYSSFSEQIKTIETMQTEVKRKIQEMLSEVEMDEYSCGGCKAGFTKVKRTMYLKEKLIKKFGEKSLKSCTKVIEYIQPKITYTHYE